MGFILALGLLLLVGHIATFTQTRKEKAAAPANARFSDSAREQIGVLTVLDAIAAAFFAIFFSLTDLRWYMIVLFFLAGAVIVWLLLALVSQWFNPLRLIAWAVCAGLVFGGIWFVRHNDRYLESITFRESVDSSAYEPFAADSRVQTLDETATLRFSEEDTLPRMDGDSALYPVYAAFCRAAYPEALGEREEADYRSVIAGTNTAYAYQSLVDGTRDVIFVTGPSQAQEEYAQKKGVELVYTPIGRDALAFFVHPESPVRNLSVSELRDIYSGQIQNWDDLGTAGIGSILAYQRDEGSGSQNALRRLVMGETPLMETERERLMSATDGIVEQAVAYQNRRNAIGYSLFSYCGEDVRPFDVKLLEVDGTAPTRESIENGSYPLTTEVYAVTRTDADENTLALLDWICGEQGRSLAARSGLISPEA